MSRPHTACTQPDSLRARVVICTSGCSEAASCPSTDDKLLTHAKVHVWLIVRAPQFGPTGVVSRDLVDMTDVVLTIANLAELKHPAPLNLCPLTPSLRGSADPFEKRNWIFAATTKVQMIRYWQHILDSQGNFPRPVEGPVSAGGGQSAGQDRAGASSASPANPRPFKWTAGRCASRAPIALNKSALECKNSGRDWNIFQITRTVNGFLGLKMPD